MPKDSGPPPARVGRVDRVDRTTLVVRLGLIVLTLTGLGAIFGESLLLGGRDLGEVGGTAPAPAGDNVGPAPTSR